MDFGNNFLCCSLSSRTDLELPHPLLPALSSLGNKSQAQPPQWWEVLKYLWLTTEIWLLFDASPNTVVPQYPLPLIFVQCKLS